MTGFHTSGTYAAWEFCGRLLAEATWPTAPVGPHPVATWRGDPDRPPKDVAAALESVVVVQTVQVPEQEWGPIGNLAREERFRVPILVRTGLPGLTPEQAADRVHELTDVIETEIRTVNAARRTGAADPVEFAGRAFWMVAIASVAPMTPPADSGFVGQALVLVDFSVRVGTPIP